HHPWAAARGGVNNSLDSLSPSSHLDRPEEMTMAVSMYQISVPVFIKVLSSLSAILRKAGAHVEARRIEPRALLAARLFPDIFVPTRQVQVACDLVKGGGARLAGVPIPSFEDKEASFAELCARIEKTVEFLKTLRAEQIDGAHDRDITLTVRD